MTGAEFQSQFFSKRFGSPLDLAESAGFVEVEDMIRAITTDAPVVKKKMRKDKEEEDRVRERGWNKFFFFFYFFFFFQVRRQQKRIELRKEGIVGISVPTEVKKKFFIFF